MNLISIAKASATGAMLAVALFAAAQTAQTPTPIDKQIVPGLKQSDVLPAIDVIQFGMAGRIDEEGLIRLTRDMVAEFEASPEAFMAAIELSKRAIEETREFEKDEEIALSRTILLSELYKIYAEEEDYGSSIITELFRQNPVLAYDPTSEIPLTKADVDAMQAYFSFLIDIVFEGTEVKGAELLEGLDNSLAENWLTFNMEQQLEVSFRPIHWTILKGKWDTLPRLQVDLYRHDIKQQLLGDEFREADLKDPEVQEKVMMYLLDGTLARYDIYGLVRREEAKFWDYFKRPTVGWNF